MFFGDHLPPDPPPQSPICPSLIPSQKDVAGGWLTVTTSQPRLAVGHSGGGGTRTCVCVHTHITIQLLRLKVMWLEWPGESLKVTDGGGVMGGIVCH